MLSAEFTIVICREENSKQEGVVTFAASPWNLTTQCNCLRPSSGWRIEKEDVKVEPEDKSRKTREGTKERERGRNGKMGRK